MVCALSGARTAHAQKIDGAFRLRLEGPLVAYERSTLFLATGWGEIDSSQTRFGTASNGAGLTLGDSIGDLVSSGRFLFGSMKIELDSLGESGARTVSFGREIGFDVSGNQGAAHLLSLGNGLLIGLALPVTAVGPSVATRFLNSLRLHVQ